MKISLKRAVNASIGRVYAAEIPVPTWEQTKKWVGKHGGWWLMCAWRLQYPWVIAWTLEGRTVHEIYLNQDPPDIYLVNPNGQGFTLNREAAFRFRTKKAALKWKGMQRHFNDPKWAVLNRPMWNFSLGW